ncbi:single-stranded DNA-binding protein [Sporosarcina sp. resist]|uniref:single-stranded DNA-binding protein n=1 Tax=Sporosarcina sp. resist TaxID=2762563 RepID=UPI00164D16E3|nr:single-stranded DNA-binding protein [Sporosarcina sp. resist]QNK90525.1 single-stranded DNA-binding protein [Sporosarcina sp. resist]
MMNNVSLVGRLTKKPELKYTQNGVAVCNFMLAVKRPFKNANGENEADFIMVQVWRKPAENAANFLKKGSQAAVNGRISTRHYENDKGDRIYVTEVVADFVQFLDPKPQGQGNQQRQGQESSQKQPNPYASNSNTQNQNGNQFETSGGPVVVSDDDLPF